MNEQQLQELFKLFLIEKTGAKDEKELNLYLLKMDKSQIELLKEEFVQILQQQQAQKARHGAKLNYVKQLKHQCAEDEKLVYFKKGGSIGCGCVKKDNGGQIKKSAVDNFKSRRKKYETDMRKAKDEAERDSIAVNKYNDQDVQTSKPGKYINGVWTPDRTKWPYNKKAKKEEKGGKTPKAGTGCMLKSKFVKKGSKIKVGCHLLGGSLNGIPFIRTPYKSTFVLSLPKQIGTTGNSIMQPGLLNEVVVSAPDKRLRFDRRVNNIGGGRQIISESLIDYYLDGNEYLGDLAKTPTGRVIYTSPRGNDTLYYNDDYAINREGPYRTGNARWIEYPHGFLQVTDYNNPRALALWKKLIRKNIVVENEDKSAVNRARKEK